MLDRGFLLYQSLSLLQLKCITIVINKSLLYFVTGAVDCKNRLICIF